MVVVEPMFMHMGWLILRVHELALGRERPRAGMRLDLRAVVDRALGDAKREHLLDLGVAGADRRRADERHGQPASAVVVQTWIFFGSTGSTVFEPNVVIRHRWLSALAGWIFAGRAAPTRGEVVGGFATFRIGSVPHATRWIARNCRSERPAKLPT